MYPYTWTTNLAGTKSLMATLFVIAEDYKTTQVSINMEQVKSTLGSPHNGTLRAIKKEGGGRSFFMY